MNMKRCNYKGFSGYPQQRVPQVQQRKQRLSLCAFGPEQLPQLQQLVYEAAQVETQQIGLGVAVVGLLAAGPAIRRGIQKQQAGGDELTAVQNYFNTSGFDRWRKIYGETDDVNKVQLDIRKGHAQTIEKVLNWIDEEGSVENVTIADAGCGTGSLTLPLLQRGAAVTASDLSSEMTKETQRQYQEAVAKESIKQPAVEPTFQPVGLEDISGSYHTVACIDVMIHYPQERVAQMIEKLSSSAEERLFISFAPKTLAYTVLKRIGELFPGPSKATRAYLHAEAEIEEALKKCGWKVVKKEMTATQFYFSRLFEAVKA